jgi:hypothetical protein
VLQTIALEEITSTIINVNIYTVALFFSSENYASAMESKILIGHRVCTEV